MTAINQGDVAIKLNGEPVILSCTLRAAKTVHALQGDFMSVVTKLDAFNFGAYVAVVAAGLGKEMKDVEESVFRTGMRDLNAALGKYIGLLANGGRPLTPADTITAEDSKPGNG